MFLPSVLSKNLLVKKKAAVVAAFFIFSTTSVLAEVKTKRAETYQDIIEKAQNLVLQKDRQQAINILSNAIRREGPKSTAASELKKTLQETSTVFLGDKAQQIYETGVTLKRTDLNQAQQKMTEGLRLEPDNMSFVLEQARISLAKGDCSAADDVIGKYKNMVSYSEEMSLVYAQILVCQKKWTEFSKLWELPENKKSSLAKFWLALEVEKWITEKNDGKAKEVLEQIKKIDSQYPEPHFWSWKIDQSAKKKNLEAVEKYSLACKNISAHLYRTYMLDPLLCRHTGEMENNVE